MKTAKQEYVTAANGLEALQKFQADPLSFRVVFMGMHHLYAPRYRHKANTDRSLNASDGWPDIN